MEELTKDNIKVRVRENAATFWERRQHELADAEIMEIVNHTPRRGETPECGDFIPPVEPNPPAKKKKPHRLRRAARAVLRWMHKEELFGVMTGALWATAVLTARSGDYASAVIRFALGAVALSIAALLGRD